ncbi:HPr family phosphocarrier protein [Streptomyces sp. HUAS ZL42]|uniref:HPr family phosphocarrier protein n=1 Tax=Streptomyces sp. HUAS ZL42 TaxID=3231715 RepID=UPI00345E6703
MAQRVVSICPCSSLHARPSGALVQAGAQASVPMTLAVDGKTPVPADSVMSAMTLGASCGNQVTLTAEGDQKEAVLEGVATLLSKDLDA